MCTQETVLKELQTAADDEVEEDEVILAHSGQADSEAEASQSSSQQEDDQKPPVSLQSRSFVTPAENNPYAFEIRAVPVLAI